MAASDYIRWFADLRMRDVPLVGGKTASLGELYSTLASEHIAVPNGFAVTPKAYRDAITEADAWCKLHEQLDDLDKTDVDHNGCTDLVLTSSEATGSAMWSLLSTCQGFLSPAKWLDGTGFGWSGVTPLVGDVNGDGVVCGKPYSVSVVAITEPGSSNILNENY